VLHSKAKIVFHTPDADVLFKGGKKNTDQFIPSYFYAQRRLNSVYSQALLKNPYAEAALIDIEYEIQGVLNFCDNKGRSIGQLLESVKERGVSSILLHDDKPRSYQVNYLTEYSSYLLSMMSYVDLLCRTVRTAHTMRAIDDVVAVDVLKEVKRIVRAVFNKIIFYNKNIVNDVTREDVFKKTPSAKVMIDRFGVPNEDVMKSDFVVKQRRLGLLGSAPADKPSPSTL